MIAACSAGETVIALPFSPRLNGATIGTFTWPSPRLEAIATGASRCAASNRPRLSLSRTFDHDTSRMQRDVEPLLARKPLVDGDQQRGRIDQRDEPDPQRRQRAWLVVRHFSSSDAVMIDCAISAIFFFSRIAVERIST